MKKKIAFILPSLNYGGAEKVSLALIKALDRKRYVPVLIILNPEGPLRNEIPKGVRAYTIRAGRLRYSLVRLIKLLMRLKADCIFSTLGYVNFAILIIKHLARLKAKIIVREATTPSKALAVLPAYKALLFKIMYRLIYPMADLIIAQSDNMRKNLIKNFGIRPDKIVRIYNPVDANKVLAGANAFIPQEYDCSEINIVAVGRLVEAKGYDVLLKAFGRLLQSEPKAHLYIIGDGPLRNRLESLCKSLIAEKKISFLGFRENPYPYMKHADLYVLSSRWEGFPNTLLEALVCGTKVVATDCESGPGEILAGGKYGLLARVDDEYSLCAKMKEYLNMESKTAGRGMDFAVEKIIVRYQRAFDRVLS